MTPQPNPKRVLVIDDDPMSRELLSFLLEHEGYAVQSADCGESALALLKRQPAPDLVLTDMQMPGTAGAELARKLRRACGPSTVLLAMSGNQPPAEAISLFSSFLLKPFHVEQVTAALLAQHEKPGLKSTASKRTTSRVKKEKPQKQEKSTGKSGPTLPSPAKAVPVAASASRTASNIAMNGEMQTHQAQFSSTLPTEKTATAVSPILNETIYRQLAVTVPSEQLNEMYTMCVNDARRRIAGMRTMAEVNDSTRFIREAHAIKGSCGMLGATELHHLAAELEAHGLESRAGGTERQVNSLDELSAACDRLERMLGSRV
jgi:CheY-like chemotaxis protein/HPt (histidine-containing phosphotransfer) domain-containing protein